MYNSSQKKQASAVNCHATYFQSVEQENSKLLKKASLNVKNLERIVSEIKTTYLNSPKKKYDITAAVTSAIFEGANINTEQFKYVSQLNKNTSNENDALHTIIADIVNDDNLSIKQKVTHGIAVGMDLKSEIQAKLGQSERRLSR